MVQSALQGWWRLRANTTTRFCVFGRGLSFKTLFLFFFGLRAVLVQKLEQLSCLILVQGIVELVDRWWGFQAVQKHLPLALKTDVLRPFHETGQVAFMVYHIPADTEMRACAGNSRFSTTVLLVLAAFFLPPLDFGMFYIDSFGFRKSVWSSLQNVNNLCSGSSAWGVGWLHSCGWPRFPYLCHGKA